MKRDPFLKDLHPVHARGRAGRFDKAIAIVLVFALILGAGTWAGAYNWKSRTFDDFFSQRISQMATINISDATSCIGSNWALPKETVISALDGGGGKIVDGVMDGLMSYFQDQLGGFITNLIGGGIRNLSGLTNSLGEILSRGMQEQLKAMLTVSLKPGGLHMSYCFSDYDDIRDAFSEGILAAAIGPNSGNGVHAYYMDMARGGKIRYPDWNTDYYNGSRDPSTFIHETGKATIAMGGPGTGLEKLVNDSKLPEETKTMVKGDMQRLNALTQLNTTLSVDGAEVVAFSQDVWRRLSQFNPDSWDNGFSEQAMKDVPKLLYIQSQIAIKQLRLMGDMAIQLSALGQVRNDELASKAVRQYMETGGANAGAR